MKLLSDTLDRVKPSPTIAVTNKAAEMKAAGHDVIGLGAGEPDFDTPQHIKDAAVVAISMGKTKYTAVDGIAELKQAICAKFKRDNDLAYTPEQVSVSSGGKQVLYNALMATLNEGDEVIIPAPYWVSYPDMVLLTGGTPVIVQASLQTGFKLTADQLEEAITPNTKWLLFNSPSNPTGAGYTWDELKSLTDVLMRHPHVWVMTDDMYEHLAYGDFKFCTPAQVEPRLYDRTLTVNGVSKAYAMTGWRLGYSVWPNNVIAHAEKLCVNIHSCVNASAQFAGIAALEGDQRPVDLMVSAFDERRKIIVKELNQISGFSCIEPGGAFYAFPNITGTGMTSDKLQQKILEEAGVAVISGTSFGKYGEGYLRFSYANSIENIQKAIKNIRACIA